MTRRTIIKFFAPASVAGAVHALGARNSVPWSVEFGRIPWSQDLSGKSPIDQHGREHQLESFCAWMAGGGVKPDLTYGDTDDVGYRVVNGIIHVHQILV